MSSTRDAERTAPPQVLVVDDEPSVRHVLKSYLEMRGCAVRTFPSAEDAEQILTERPFPDVALVDIVLPGKSGLDMLGVIRRRCPDAEVVLITSYGSAESAISAIRRGAYDYLTKPFDSLDQVWVVLRRALDKKRTAERIAWNGAGPRESDEEAEPAQAPVPTSPRRS